MTRAHIRLVSENDNRRSPYANERDAAAIARIVADIERDIRSLRRRMISGMVCTGVAALALIYFAFQLVRGVL